MSQSCEGSGTKAANLLTGLSDNFFHVEPLSGSKRRSGSIDRTSRALKTVNVHNLCYHSGEVEEALYSEPTDLILPQVKSRIFKNFLSISFSFCKMRVLEGRTLWFIFRSPNR